MWKLIVFITFAQTNGINKKEVVQEKAMYKIEDYKKPGGILLPSPFFPLDSLTGILERRLSIQISNLSDLYYKNSIKFRPLYLRVPVSKSMASSVVIVKVPMPPKKYGIKAWSLTIFGPRGEVVKQFQGKGIPPKTVKWDGRYADEYLTPGATYSSVLNYIDRYGRKRRIIGGDIKVPGIKGKIKDKFILKMVADSIFLKNSYKLRKDGRERIDEISNFLKEHFFGVMIIRVKGDAGGMLSERVRVLRREVLKRVPVDPARLKIEEEYFTPSDLKIPLVEVIAG